MRGMRMTFVLLDLLGRLIILFAVGIAYGVVGLAHLVKYLAIALAWLAYWLGRLLIMPYAAYMRAQVTKGGT